MMKSIIYGKLAFLISGLLGGILIRYDSNYLLAMVVTGAIGCALLSVFIKLTDKMLIMTMAGGAAMPLGLMLSFGIVEGSGAIFPWLAKLLDDTWIPDILAIVLLCLFFGIVVGTAIYGKKAVLRFAVIMAIVGIPFGTLIAVFNLLFYDDGPYSDWLKYVGNIDINFLAMALSIGVGLGLSIGMTKLKSKVEP